MQASQQYFFTKNEVFNEIANLRWGSSLLILDETHFESILFLDALLQKSLPPAKMHIVSYHNIDATIETMKLDLEQYTSLQEISIAINRLREQIGPCGVLIHHYLPHILTREPEENVLRMLEFWTTKTAEKNLIEFYTLPQGTFPTMEKKASAFMTGEISIRFAEKPERHLHFIMKRACKPPYHLVAFPFITKEGRLLIKWGEEFTDRILVEETNEINKRVDYLKENSPSLKIVKGKTEPEGLKPYEYWLLTQILDKRVTDIHVLFPDKFEEILKTIARLNLRNIVAFETVKGPLPPPPAKDLKLKSKIALMLPFPISKRLLYRGHHYLAVDAYKALRKSVEYFGRYMPTRPELSDEVVELEKYFQEISARITSVERILKAGDDPRIKFDLKYVPKCVSLTINSAIKVKPKVVTKPNNVYEVIITDCALCSGMKGDKPLCGQLGYALTGMCGVCFKELFTCEEIRCMAMGDEACVFILKKM